MSNTPRKTQSALVVVHYNNNDDAQTRERTLPAHEARTPCSLPTLGCANGVHRDHR